MKQEVIETAIDLWAKVLTKPPPVNTNDLWKDHLKICEVLKSIEEHQTKFEFQQDRLSKLDNFIKWSNKSGIQYPGVAIKETEMGLSLVATEALSADSIAVKVPRDAIMSLESDIDDGLRFVLNTDEVVRSVDHIGLALILCNEMLKSSSEWKGYLDILPTTYTTPLFFTYEQLQQLKPSLAFEESVSMFRTIVRHYIYFFMRLAGERNLSKNKKKVLKNAPFQQTSLNLQNFTLDLYRWCVSTVTTRINMIPSLYLDEKNELQPRMIPSLIPFMDLANHAMKSSNPGHVYFDVETNSVDLKLNASVDVGSEIFIYYGARTNRKFLVHNGFVPTETNPDDFYELRIGLPKNENSIWKYEYLHQKSILLEKNSFTFKLKSQDLDNGTLESRELFRLLEFAKTFVAQTKEELSKSNNDEKAKKFVYDRISLLLLGYKDFSSQEPSESGDLVAKHIWRLKHSERKLLKGFQGILHKN